MGDEFAFLVRPWSIPFRSRILTIDDKKSKEEEYDAYHHDESSSRENAYQDLPIGHFFLLQSDLSEVHDGSKPSDTLDFIAFFLLAEKNNIISISLSRDAQQRQKWLTLFRLFTIHTSLENVI